MLVQTLLLLTFAMPANQQFPSESFDIRIKNQNKTPETFKVMSMFEPYFLLHQSLATDAILVIVMTTVWILAMVAKYSIFKTIFNIGIWTRPINLLILVDQTQYNPPFLFMLLDPFDPCSWPSHGTLFSSLILHHILIHEILWHNLWCCW